MLHVSASVARMGRIKIVPEIGQLAKKLAYRDKNWQAY
jgi:hypothetical protein